MQWLQNYNIYVQGAILSGIIFALLMVVLAICFIFKPDIGKEKIKYIYSFSSGFILITAIVGQFVSARTSLHEHFEGLENPNEPEPSGVEWGPTLTTMAIILGGIIIGVIIALLVNKAFTNEKKNIKTSSTCKDHSSKVSNTYESMKIKQTKLPALILILAHRIPAGISIGGLISLSNMSGENAFAYANLFAFILHIVPEALIVFYGFGTGKDKVKSLLFSIAVKLPLIPMIFVGVAIGHSTLDSENLYWLQPLLFSIVGTTMVWAVISELIPEFIHNRFKFKTINKMLIVFIAGVSLSMIIQLIHVH